MGSASSNNGRIVVLVALEKAMPEKDTTRRGVRKEGIETGERSDGRNSVLLRLHR